MRIFAVDERDSTWERDDARFRVYVFDGPGHAVTAFDIVGLTVRVALEAAAAMSDCNKKLWALALVETDARALPGLIWLSGMDYNDPPGSPREWQRRRQMQDRYLLATRERHVTPTLPDGLRVIRVFPEWVSGWPLWESFTDEYRRTGPELGLSVELSDALYRWNETWLSRAVDDPVPARWESDGLALVARLRTELDGIAEVRPEFLTAPGPEERTR